MKVFLVACFVLLASALRVNADLPRCKYRSFVSCLLGFDFVTANDWDEKFQFECPSVHKGEHEDRVYHYQCGETSLQLSTSKWTSYINEYRENFEEKCQENSVVTGLYGVHDNSEEDRRFKLRCTKIAANSVGKCKWTLYTIYDKIWHLGLPSNHYIRGMRSEFSGRKKDRIFSFYLCKFT